MFQIFILIAFIFNVTKQEQILYLEEFIHGNVQPEDFDGWLVGEDTEFDDLYQVDCAYPGEIIGKLNEQQVKKTFINLPPHYEVIVELEALFYGEYASRSFYYYYDDCKSVFNNGREKTEDYPFGSEGGTDCVLYRKIREGQFSIYFGDTEVYFDASFDDKDGPESYCSYVKKSKRMQIRKVSIHETHNDEEITITLKDVQNYEDKTTDAMWGFHNFRIFLNLCDPSCLTCTDGTSCETCIENATSLGVNKGKYFQNWFITNYNNLWIYFRCLLTLKYFPNICKCNSGYILQDGVCIDRCDKGLWSDPDTRTCTKKEGQLFTVIDEFYGNDFTDAGVFTLDPVFQASDITTCSGEEILGGYQKFQARSMSYLSITVYDHTQIRIRLKLYKIDNWDNNKFIILSNSQEIYSKTFGTSTGTNLCGTSQKDEIFIIDEVFDHSGFRLDLVFTDDLVPGSSGYWGVKELFVDILAFSVGCDIGSLYADDECSVCRAEFLMYENKCRTDCPIYTEVGPGSCSDTGIQEYYYPYTAYQGMFENKFSSRELVDLGWNVNDATMTELSSFTTQCGDYTILGGYGIGDTNTNLEFTFVDMPSHYKAILRFTLYLLDDWEEGDEFAVYIDGELLKTALPTEPVTYEYTSITLHTDTDLTATTESICGGLGVEYQGSKKYIIESHTEDLMVIKFAVNSDKEDTRVLSAGIRDLNIVLEQCQYLTCALCVDKDGCLNCKYPYFLDPENKECKLCSDGEFVHEALYTPYYTGICSNCPHECFSCTQESPTECDVCKDIRENSPTCNCPYGYYNDPNVDPCIKCNDKCDGCDINGCTACQENRILDADNNCGCVDLVNGVYTDHYPYTMFCGTCSIAVLKVYYSADFNSIQINFDGVSVFKINGVSDTDKFKPKETTCDILFPADILSILGAGYTCQILETNQQIIQINLGFRSQVYPGQLFVFKDNKVQRSGCGSTYFSTYVRNDLSLSANQANPDVELVGPIPGNSICEEKSIYVNKIINDANFGFLDFKWELVAIVPSDKIKRLEIQEQLLDPLNENKIQSITMPPGYLNVETTYNFQITFNTYLGTGSQKIFELITGGNESALLEFPYASVPQYFRWEKIDLKANLFHIKCTNVDDVQQVFGDVFVRWNQYTGQENLNITQSFDSLPAIESQVTIQPYTAHYEGDNRGEYIIEVTIALLSAPLQYTRNLTINIVPSPLHAEIVGGSRLAQLAKDEYITGITKDYDFDPSDPFYNSTYGINYRWDCFDLNNNFDPCEDRFGNFLVMDSLDFLIPANSMVAYNGYQFTLNLTTGKRNTDLFRSYEVSEIIIFQELEIPQIQVIHDDLTQQRRNFVNLNDLIQANIVKGDRFSNITDDIYYTVDFIYNYKTVGNLKSMQNLFEFKIWDQFVDFVSTPNITLKYSVYHPSFLMPSQSNYKIMTNLGPYSCVIDVDVQTGFSLSTEYQISITSCLDIDQPFSYRFYLYDSEEAYEKERAQPEIRQGLILNQYKTDNQIKTMLPQGLSSENYDQVLLISIIDARGGILNVTETLHIEPNEATTSVQYLDYIQSLLDTIEYNYLDDKIYELVKLIIDYKRNPVVQEGAQFDKIRLQIYQKLFVYREYLPSTSDLDAYILWAISLFKTDFNMFYGSMTYQYKNYYLQQFGNMQEQIIQKFINRKKTLLSRDDIKDIEKNNQAITDLLDILGQFIDFVKFDPNEENIIKNPPVVDGEDGEQNNQANTRNLRQINLSDYKKYLIIKFQKENQLNTNIGSQSFQYKKNNYRFLQTTDGEDGEGFVFDGELTGESTVIQFEDVVLDEWDLSTFQEKDLMSQNIYNLTLYSLKTQLLYKEINTAPIKFVNSNILIVANKVTHHNLYKYIDGGIENSNINNFNNDLPKKDYLFFPEGPEVVDSYQVIFIKYTNNHPFLYDPDFPYPEQSYPMVIPNILQDQNNVTMTMLNKEPIEITQPIKHTFIAPPLKYRTVQIYNPITMEMQTEQFLIKRYCASQVTDPFDDQNKIWDIQSCGQKRITLPDGNIEFECTCNNLSPVTLLDDYNYVWDEPFKIEEPPVIVPIPPVYGDYEGFRPWHNLEIFWVLMILTFLCAMFIPWSIGRDGYDEYKFQYYKIKFIQSEFHQGIDEKNSIFQQIQVAEKIEKGQSVTQLEYQNNININEQDFKYKSIPQLLTVTNKDNRYVRDADKRPKPVVYKDINNFEQLEQIDTEEQQDQKDINNVKNYVNVKPKTPILIQTQTQISLSNNSSGLNMDNQSKDNNSTNNKDINLKQAIDQNQKKQEKQQGKKSDDNIGVVEDIEFLQDVGDSEIVTPQKFQQQQPLRKSRKTFGQVITPYDSQNSQDDKELKVQRTITDLNKVKTPEQDLDSNRKMIDSKTVFNYNQKTKNKLVEKSSGFKKNSQDSFQKIKQFEYTEDQKKFILLYSTITYHKLFSIFLIYEQQLPRAIKVITFYFENLSLVVVARFLQVNKYYYGVNNLEQYGILYCLILSVAGDLLRFIMRQPFYRYFVLMLIIIIGIILSWIYIFSYAQNIERDESLDWPYFYLRLVFIDNLIIQTSLSVLKTLTLLLTYKAGQEHRRGPISKILFRLVNQQGILHFWVGFLSLNK